MSAKKTKRDIDKEKMFNKIMPSAAAGRTEDSEARPLYPRPPIVDTLSDGNAPQMPPSAAKQEAIPPVTAAPVPAAPAPAPVTPGMMPVITPIEPLASPQEISPLAAPELPGDKPAVIKAEEIPVIEPLAPPPAEEEKDPVIEQLIPEVPEPQMPHMAQEYQQTASFAELLASKTGQHIEPHRELHEETHAESVTVTDITPITPENANETVLINIKERMVMKKLEKSLEKFNCCKCYFCRQDVVAAALNLLPPKYMVVVRGDIDALIKKENDQEVTAALIKAILHVRGNPRH